MGSTADAVLKMTIFARMQLLTEIRIHLGSTAVAVFKHDEIMHLCKLLSEIRIHLRAQLQPLFSEMSSFCTYAITVRDSNPLMGSTAVSVLKHDEILHVCNY
ncbi:hypothetical protein CEXT_75271 [Caerostris extrusa]|uniref:Uncharacterized protein n=1 Tax=Caerostris extrusa TaxID=172846 RepID=A0AAV4PUS0_CAEEX|nr:hypothetical protein CEXT_75271 [Caerostris extrusa]